MQKRHESNPQDTPSTAVGALEERLEALERQIAERPAGAESEHHTHASHPLQDELSAQLERHRDELRDYEKALVERIADVDDDRRATASRMSSGYPTPMR